MKIENFKGMAPYLGVTNQFARYVLDADLRGDVLRPWRSNLDASNVGNARSIFETRCCMLSSLECVDWASGSPACNELVYRTDSKGLYQATESEACKNQWCKVGWPCPMLAPEVSSIDPVGKPDTAFQTTMVAYTFVNKYGQRSAPSALSASFLATYGTKILVSNLPLWSAEYCITKLELWVVRSAETTGNEAANTQNTGLFKAGELTVRSAIATIDFDDVGEWCETVGFESPPADLSNIVSWGNQLAGLSNGSVIFSGIGYAQNWMMASRLKGHYVAQRLVAGRTMGFVLTDAKPLVFRRKATCTTTDCHEADELDGPAIVSPRSAAVVDDLCIYAAQDGLYMINGGRVERIMLWTPKQWQDMRPDTMQGAIHDGHYFGFSQNAAFRVSLRTPTDGMTYLSERPSAVHGGFSKRLYLGEPTAITSWNEGFSYDTAVWESHSMMTRNMALTAARVQGSADKLTVSSDCGTKITNFGAVSDCDTKVVIANRMTNHRIKIETTKEVSTLYLAASRMDIFS